ncbi:kinesin-like protein KIN-7H isoform X2 [Salvia splendens]|nr:kinesin-like protein KIN-7H isoform X2 [Salvia splendens]
MTGVTEYAIADIYDYIQKHSERDFVLKFSALEIYNESVRDLLSVDSTPLRLLDDPERGTVVEKLTEETIRDWDHVIQLLSVCEAERQIGETSLNEVSSRSHQIIRLTVESSPREFTGSNNVSAFAAAVNFVDLAGSERASQANSAGTRLKEGCHINRSLLTLGTVIRKLSKGRGRHIPYRDSKLTRILQTSLGGNARTAIICTMSPARSHVEQSRNTLLFASCAKEVATSAQVNVVMSDKALVKCLQRELVRLESELRNYQSDVSTPNYPSMLREKDHQIAKLEEKLNEVIQQRDVAQSQVKDLLEIIGNEESLTEVEVGEYPRLRVQRSPDNKMEEEEEEEEEERPHSSDGDARTCSPGHSRTSSDGQIAKVPYFDESFALGNASPMILASHSSDSYSDHGWEETEKQSNRTLEEDICREVRCIEAEESSNRVASEEDTEIPQAVESSSTPFENNGMIEENDFAMEEQPQEHVGKGSLSPPSKEAREFSSIQTPDLSSRATRGMDQDSPLATFFKLTKSRSCRARMAGLNSPWLDFSEITSSIGSERGYVDFDKNQSPLIFTPFIRDLSRKASRVSTTFDIEIDPSQDMHSKNQSDESPKRHVKDVGLDPIVDERRGLSNWPVEFRRLQQEIVELWHACNVSLIHRSYFFTLFQGGDASDAVYMEVEVRRMKFLKDKFARGESTIVNGQCLTLALSLKALREERRMLSNRMSRKLSEQERESLFLKWGIDLDSKLRRLQLSYRIWTKTDDMDHVSDSAFLVAKLVNSTEHGQAHHKEMFGLNFTPRHPTRFHSSFRQNLISFL